MLAIQARVDGLQQVMGRLAGVRSAVRKKILRSALNAGGKIVLDAAKARAPRDTGLLRKSLGKKTKVYRQSGVVVVIVGPRTGMSQQVSRRDRKKQRREDPSNIAHLAGPGRRQTFMTDAAASTVTRVRDVVKQKILEGLENA